MGSNRGSAIHSSHPLDAIAPGASAHQCPHFIAEAPHAAWCPSAMYANPSTSDRATATTRPAAAKLGFGKPCRCSRLDCQAGTRHALPPPPHTAQHSATAEIAVLPEAGTGLST
eukprot:TRINITY_DN98_c1_g1_i1.p1 TRINITY_DN98_c1_g1~~TRINITY_DN98_c1_g1_i1.p1  ORF type:complete len:114 (+),score=0.51 TRINITY_DN98_c1_g1_i1:547-888(+)